MYNVLVRVHACAQINEEKIKTDISKSHSETGDWLCKIRDVRRMPDVTILFVEACADRNMMMVVTVLLL